MIAPLSRCLLTVSIASIATATAQVVSSDQVIGWSTLTPITAPGQIDIQDIDGSCKPARTLCTRVLSGNTKFPSGGTAYDSSRQAVWVSDGSTIVAYALPSCRTICTFKAQLVNTGAVVSGLAISDSKQRLIQLESTQGSVSIRSYDMRTCPPTPLRDGCTLSIQSNATAGGLAYDEARNLLYFTESAPALVGWLSNLYIASFGNACRPICKVPMRSCGSGARGWGAIDGLAYSSCKNQLYATDGVLTSITTMTDPPKCSTTHVTCCARQSTGSFRGLAVIPGWKQRTVGKSCLPATCNCPSMTSRLGSEPRIGNASFGFELSSGPSGQYGFVLLGAGCGSGIPVPVLCGPLYTLLTPPPLVLPAVKLQGAACSGTATSPLAIPLSTDLCGIQLCAQWIVLCAPILGSSEAIEFTIAGS